LSRARWRHFATGPHGSGLTVALTGSKGSFRMKALAVEQTYVISEPFDKAVKLIRSALAETELGVVGEFDTTEAFGKDPEKKSKQSRILLVDCPLLVFEAQALDRSAGVFFPLHVLVRADADRTQVSTVSSRELFDVRLPSGATDPMDSLQARVALALESVLRRMGANHHEERGQE
jgi:uncharacterized protein (DUF302 family)